jgi:ubiquinone/menaquinone biosynthesis C-methylase UbiE
MTISYYDNNADAFRQRTSQRAMSQHYEPFVALLPPGGNVLDAGCGPGRDTLVFLARGFRVVAFDASRAMVELATKQTGQPVLHATFQQIEFEKDTFDGVWACASLLHVPSGEIDDVLHRVTRSLKFGGAMYMSVKVGDGERIADDGRFFCDYTHRTLRDLLARHPSLEILDISESPPNPQSPDGKSWLHALVRKTG